MPATIGTATDKAGNVAVVPVARQAPSSWRTITGSQPTALRRAEGSGEYRPHAVRYARRPVRTPPARVTLSRAEPRASTGRVASWV
ncbi:MAG: hypothetical protein WBH47_15360 [Streptosporangiaceae bacterium]